MIASAWHTATYVLTFPEGLVWPGLRNGWYPIVCAAWFPIGTVALIYSAVTD